MVTYCVVTLIFFTSLSCLININGRRLDTMGTPRYIQACFRTILVLRVKATFDRGHQKSTLTRSYSTYGSGFIYVIKALFDTDLKVFSNFYILSNDRCSKPAANLRKLVNIKQLHGSKSNVSPNLVRIQLEPTHLHFMSCMSTIAYTCFTNNLLALLGAVDNPLNLVTELEPHTCIKIIRDCCCGRIRG